MSEQVLQQIQKNYEEQRSSCNLPRPIVRYRKDVRTELFECKYHANELHLRASNSLSAAYALSLASVSARAGYLGEWVGKWQAPYSLRPILLHGDQALRLPSGGLCSIPHHLLSVLENKESLLNWVTRLVSFGYNAVLFAMDPTSQIEPITAPFQSFMKQLQEYGLSIGVQPVLSDEPMEPQLRRLLRDLPSIDFIYWPHAMDAALGLTALQRREWTQCDTALWYAQQIERLLPAQTRMIFSLLAKDEAEALQQSYWITDLGNQLDPSSILAFPALSGPYEQSHLPLHPYWYCLQRATVPLGIPLLPIANAGGIGLGEGYWPVLTTQLVNSIVPRMRRHRFCGLGVLSSGLPRKDGFAAANLWVWGGVQWRPISGEHLAEAWFDGLRPDLNIQQHQVTLQYAWEAVRVLSELKSDTRQKEVFAAIERILPWVSQVNKQTDLVPKGEEGWVGQSTMTDYLRFYVRDLCHLIDAAFDSLRLPSPFPVSESNSLAGIWTAPEKNIIRPTKQPRFDADDPRMTLVFHENRVI